jgi:hypothetical protein
MRPMSAAARKNRSITRDNHHCNPVLKLPNRVIVDARDGVGWTALHHAAARGHMHCVAALVNGRVDL